MANQSPVAAGSLPDPTDEVVALRSTWPGAVLGKSFHLGPDGAPAKPAEYRAGMFFVPEAVPVHGIRELHAVWEHLALEGDSIVVRGGLSGARVPAGTGVSGSSFSQLGCDHVTRRTGGSYKDRHPAGLCDVPRRWLLLDLDKVCNVFGLDPRAEPRAVLEFLLDLLPSAIRQAVVSWNWSSSMCVGVPIGQAPRKLSAHLRIWLDTPLAHREARTLLERLCRFATLRLRDPGIVPSGGPQLNGVVDWKVAEPQQPLYVAAPRFVEGIADPFPGGLRRGLYEGGDEVVRLADLEAELDAAIANLVTAERKIPANRRTTQIRTKALRTKPPVPRSVAPPPPESPTPESSADVVPVAAARRLAEARIRAKGGPDKRTADRTIFAARASLEVVRLVRGRVVAGATDHRWRDWHAAGGVPEGLRDKILFSVGCLVAEAMPRTELTRECVTGAILEIGRLIIGREWLEDCWTAGRYGDPLVNRAVAAGFGETELWQGEHKDPRYRIGRARLLRDFAIQRDEVARYSLISLASGSDRLATKRRAQGATPRAEVQAANLEKAQQAIRLITGGSSQRAAAAAVGLDEKQLRRILKAEGEGGLSTACSDQAKWRVAPICSARRADSSSTGSWGIVGERGETPLAGREKSASPPAPLDPWIDFEQSYATLVSAARTRGAEVPTVVPAPPPAAPDSVCLAYRAALEAVADARRRADMRHRRKYGPASLVRAWYDALTALPMAEARVRVRTRRRDLVRAQRAEHAATIARNDGERALRSLELRHRGVWAMENRHAARVLGAAYVRGRQRYAQAKLDVVLHKPRVSAAWRKAIRAAEGLVRLTTEERDLVLVARAAAVESDAERNNLQLVRQAVAVVLNREA